MKIITGRYDLIKFIFIPFTLLSILLFFYPPNWIAGLHVINWFFILGIVVCSIRMPRLRLGNHTQPSYSVWVTRLFLLQFSLNLFLWGLQRFIAVDLPVYTPSSFSFHFFTYILYTAFFPWGVTTLTAIMLGYFIYQLQRVPLFSSVYTPCFKNDHHDSIGVAVDSYMRLLCLMSMIFVVIFFSLATLKLISGNINFVVTTGFYFSLVILSTLLIFLTSNKVWNKLVRFGTFHLSPTVVIFLYAILLSLIVIGVQWLMSQLKLSLDLQEPVLFLPNLKHWEFDFVILIDFIGFALATLIGAWVATISQERKVVTLVMVSFIANLLAWLIIWLVQQTLLRKIQLSATWVILICSLIFIQLLNKPAIFYLIRGEIPTKQTIKPRSPLIFVRTLLSSATLLYSLFLVLGVYIFSFICVLSLLPCVFIVFIGACCFVKETMLRSDYP